MRIRAAFLVAAALAACATAPAVDVTAGPGEPRAIDSVCRIFISDEEHNVTAICPSESEPGVSVVRASLVQGYGLRLAQIQLSAVPIPEGGVGFRFAIAAKSDPIRVAPLYPAEAARTREVAHCATRFDLTPSGTPTNICIHCAATRVPGLFEVAIRDAIKQWVYPTEADAEPGAQRTNIRVELNMQLENPGEEPKTAPPLPASACPVPDGSS